MDVRLKIIRKPDKKKRSIIESKVFPVFKGEGPYNYLCGNCPTVLCEGMQKGQVGNIVIRCPKCGRYNSVK